jgi:hypothetical protein
VDDRDEQALLTAAFEIRADVASIRTRLEQTRMAKPRPKKTIRDDQDAYDERTRMLEEALRRRGVPTGHDKASRDARTRLIEEAIERHRARRERS